MFSHITGGIAKLDVFLSHKGGILFLAVDAGGTLQLLQTKQSEMNQDGYNLCSSPRVDTKLGPKDYAKEGFDLGHIRAAVEQEIQSKDGKQSWASWKIALKSKEKRRDFEREIDNVEKSLMKMKDDIAQLMSSNYSLPGENERKSLFSGDIMLTSDHL